MTAPAASTAALAGHRARLPHPRWFIRRSTSAHWQERQQREHRQQRQPADQSGTVEPVGREGERDGARSPGWQHPALLPAIDGDRRQPGPVSSVRDPTRVDALGHHEHPRLSRRWRRPARGGRRSTHRSAQKPLPPSVIGRPADRPAVCRPSTNAAPGLISNSCCPAGSMIGSAWHGCAGTGPPSSSAPTVVLTEVCTN